MPMQFWEVLKIITCCRWSFESDLFRNKISFSKNIMKPGEPIAHVFRVFRPQDEKIIFIFNLGLEKNEAFNKSFR